MSFDEREATVRFAVRTAELRAEDGVLRLTAVAATEDELRRVEQVVRRPPRALRPRDGLAVAWTPA